MTEVLQLWIMQSVQLRKINEPQNENHMGYFKDANVYKDTNVRCIYSTVNSRMVNMFLYQMGYFPNVVQFLRINCLGSFPFDREIFYSNLLVRVLIPEHEEIGIFH